MHTDDADVLFALEGRREVEAVYELLKPPPGWPRLFVSLADDNPYSLGIVTGILVRTLPHRDRSHIGIAFSDRLRRLWLPLGAPLRLSPSERESARARGESRERDESALRVRVAVDPPPISVPVRGPFQPDAIWTIRGQKVVVLQPEPDPFPSPKPLLLVITDDDALFRRIEAHAPRNVVVARASSVIEAKTLLTTHLPSRTLCSEAFALGDGHMLDWLEQEHPEHLASFEIVCASSGSDWLAKYLERRARRLEILEEPLENDAIEELIQRTRRAYRT